MGELVHLGHKLLAYTIWADREHLGALAEVDEEHLLVDTGMSFSSLQGTMAHVLGSEQTWVARFVGARPERVPGIDDYPDLETLRAGFEEHWAELEFFLASLTEEQMAGELTWVNTRGETFTEPLWQPLVHMVNHSTYHRGQVAGLLRQLGYAAPSTDLVYYLATR